MRSIRKLLSAMLVLAMLTTVFTPMGVMEEQAVGEAPVAATGDVGSAEATVAPTTAPEAPADEPAPLADSDETPKARAMAQHMSISLVGETKTYNGSAYELEKVSVKVDEGAAQDMTLADFGSTYGVDLTVSYTKDHEKCDSCVDAGSYSAEVSLPNGAHEFTSEDQRYVVQLSGATLKIEKCDLTVRAKGGRKSFDNTPLNADCTVTGLPSGMTVQGIYEGTTTITNAGEATFTVTGAKVFKDGADVTKNFNVIVDEAAKTGKLEIVKIRGDEAFTTRSAEKTYDGTPLNVPFVQITQIPSGYTYEGVFEGASSITDVQRNSETGEVESVSFKATGVKVLKDGVDVSQNFYFRIRSTTGTLKINPAPLTVRAKDDSKNYDGKPLEADVEVTGLPEGFTVEASYNGPTSLTEPGGILFHVTDVKVFKDGVDVTKNFDVTIEKNTGSLTINAAPVTVAAKGGAKPYDGTPLYADVEVTGLPEGFTAQGLFDANLDGQPDQETPSLTEVDAVNFRVLGAKIFKNGVDVTENFTVSVDSAATDSFIEITPVSVVVKAKSGEKTYDGKPLKANCEVLGLPAGFEAQASYGGTSSITNVGDASFSLTSDGVKIFKDGADVTKNFAITVDSNASSGTLKINPASVTVSADNKGMDFGAQEPKLTATVTGLVEGDALNYTLEREKGDVPGTYAITAKGEKVQGNYNVTYVPGTLTIYGNVVVKADDKALDYGETEPALTATVTGLNEGDAISYTLEREKGDMPGTYTITPKGETVQGYYRIQFVTGTMTIRHLNVTVTADDQAIDYGAEEPKLTATVEGLRKGDKVHYTLKREEGDVPGTYNIVPTGDEIQGVYKVTYVPGTMTIHHVPVTVTADVKTVAYGEAFELTATVVGTLGEDTIAYTLSRDGADPAVVGEYTITPAGDEIQGIYKVTYAPAKLTVVAADVVVTVDAKTKVYGDADPELTATVTGLVGDDTIDYVLNREVGEDVGTYDIIVEGKTQQGNYDIVYVNGEMEITPAPVVVTVDAKTKVYGDADPELTAVVTGLKFGETTDKIAYALNREAGEDVGSYEIVAEGETAQGNYAVTYVASAMEITLAPVVVTADAKTKVYGEADPELTATVTGLKFDETADVLRFAIQREAGENAGAYAITPSGEAVQGNYEVTYAPAEEGFEITTMPVVLTLEGGKAFGVKDPANSELTVLYAVDAAALADASKADALKTVLDAEAEGKNLPEWFGYDETAIHREAGEKLGAYDLMFGDAEAQTPVCGNYSVTFVTGKDSFVITDKDMPWSIVINGGRAFDTHTSSVNYQIVAKDETIQLIDNFHDNMTVAYAIVEGAEVEGAPDVAIVNPAFAADDDGDDKTGTIQIPAMTYAKEGMQWTSYMPAGSHIVLTATIAANDVEEAIVTATTEAVVAPEMNMAASVHAGAGMNVYPKDAPATLSGGEALLLDENGYVQYVESVQDGAKAYIGGDDFIDVTFTYKDQTARYVTTYDAYLKDGMNLAFIQNLLGAKEGDAWFGTNPADKITVTCKPLDTVNHGCSAVSFTLGFDTGAENSAQEIGNRPEEVELSLALKDTYQAAGTAGDSAFGGVVPSVTAGEGGMVWNNVAAWKTFPEALPKSGTKINISFKDYVGHDVQHAITVVRSAATTGTSVYVKPMTDSTVPSGKLEFYGDANVWEELILTVGGRTYAVSALKGDVVYDSSAKTWRQTVDLSEIDFPVGVATNVSIAYADLNGEGASIEITYKDEAQTPVLGGQPIVGGTMLWGYVEASASVLVDILHADGTTTPVPSGSVAVDQFGYFVARLDDELAMGDQIILRTTDFCGNQKTVKLDVATELEENAYAELLGANIVGEVKDEALGLDSMEHRFATPVDLGALAADEDKTIELPILAYKSIEIGKALITLNEQGRLEINYNITASDYIPEGAQVRMSYAAEKPDAKALALGVTDVAVENLFEALEGALPTIDVSGYADENGEYHGVIWLAVHFDIEMDEDSFISRGGRGVNFYRWLTENLQTEEILNAVYSETYTYEENMAYYKLYQEFEFLAK